MRKNYKENFDQWFEEWISKFKTSIFSYDYYVDFPKIYRNIDKIKVELNILNSLIGSSNIENEFKTILSKYPNVLKVIPILLAIRKYEIYCQDDKGSFSYSFISRHQNYTIEQYAYFMRETGLFELLEKHLISNLVDYVTGVEVGLDTNARKNRSGFLMEALIEEELKKSNLEYYKQMRLKEVAKKWKMDLKDLPTEENKQFDFVVKTDNFVYVIECNFYSSQGSKLNETARSYQMLAEKIKDVNGLKFIWFTDGIGWCSAKNNLKDTFNYLDDIYSLTDLEQKDALKEIFK
ncbi:MAG TPA: restriction endonuclease [Acholeplasma sp.]|nr:restriction endonuclease [Acholeplasma sp.]